MRQLLLIAFRSLLQHKTRTYLLGGAIAAVTALLLILTGILTGLRATMLESATTLSTGHVNVGGFFKVTSGQSAPIVTNSAKIVELIKKEIPEVEFITQRGRGWARIVSDAKSLQLGIGGIDIAQEEGFKKVITVKEGKLEDLAQPNSILIFEEQAKKLEVKVGDKLTISAPTFRGINNTIDVTIVAIANNIGMMSSFNVFVQAKALRDLYQLNDDTTGAVQIYLTDIRKVQEVQAKLRQKLTDAGFPMMENDPRAFWMKFEKVNREDWTGQKLDVTNWEDEISFIKWTDTAFTALAVFVPTVLMFIICIGVMIILWISIRERTREIGTLRAIGMQRTGVLTMFVTEGFLLAAFGTLFGGLLGLVIGAGLNAAHLPLPIAVQLFLMTNHLVVTPTLNWLIAAVILVTSSISLVSLIPSFFAARMKPITAIHHIG